MINEWDYWAKISLLFSSAYDDSDRVKSKRGWWLFLDHSRIHSKNLQLFVEMLISEGVLVEDAEGFFVLSDWRVLQKLLASHPAVRVLELHFSMTYNNKLRF